VAVDADRTARLVRSRAIGLLRTCFALDIDTLDLQGVPFGVIATVDRRAWIVSMSDDLAVLGGVLVWIDRHGLAEVDLIVDHHAGEHARRAGVLAPECRVWEVVGSEVRSAVPAPIPAALDRPEDFAPLESVLSEAGVELVCENGVLRAEVAGLEVARIVRGPDGPVLEAGVGRFDREAGALLHAGRSPMKAVAETVAQVRPHRIRGAVSHPVNRLARERWLRAEVVADPGSVEISMPALVEPIPPRTTLLEAVPAAVLGHDGDRRILVVCSVGADLGLVPAIADLVLAHRPDAVRIVVPERDRLAHLERLVERLPVATEILTVSVPWVD
jgi:hypothetical protein